MMLVSFVMGLSDGWDMLVVALVTHEAVLK